MRPAASLSLAALLLSGSGCIVENNEHCANRKSSGSTSGDDYCATEFPGQMMVCTDGSCNPDGLDKRTGCAPADQIEDLMCHCPQGGCNVGSSSSTGDGDGDDTSTTSTGDGDGDGDGDTTSMTGDGDGDGDGSECTEVDTYSETCAAAAGDGDDVFCSGGQCVDCSGLGDGADAACEALDAATPLCVGTACEECGEDADCPIENPVCGADNTCGPCNSHAQCPESACNLETGGCMDGEQIFYVNGQTGDDVANDGLTPGSAFETIGHAIGAVTGGGAGVVKVEGFAGTYLDSVIVGGKTIALIGDGMPVLQGENSAGIAINSGGVAFVSGFQIQNSTFEGINCNGPTLWLDDSIISANSTDGLSINPSCTTTVRNSMFSGHGSVMSPDTQIRNGGDLTLSYSTVLGLSAQSGTADVLICTGSATVRNSILLGLATDRVNCPGGAITHSAVNDADFPADETNTDPMTWMSTWFVDSDNGDLHLTGTAPAQFLDGTAALEPTDLQTDIDGEARPAMGYVGADEPN